MANISLTEIINRKNCKFEEPVLWSILSMSLETIQNSDLIDKSGLFLITPDNICISSSGQLIFLSKSHYNKIFYPPKSHNLNNDWSKSNTDDKAHILLYSLGKTLEFCINCKNGVNSTISKELWFIINQMTNRSANGRIGLSNLHQMCNKIAKNFTHEKSFNEYLMAIHQGSTQMPKIMRSLSTSSLLAKGIGKSHEKSGHCGNTIKKLDLEENKNSNDCTSQNNSSVISSNASDSNVNSSSISTPRSVNLYQPRFDNYNKSNIPAALERVKALRKDMKAGPVRSPRNMINGLRNSADNIGNAIQSNGHSGCPVNSLSMSSIGIVNVERLDSVQRILGPEFIIRQNETVNVTSSSQRKISLFSRSDSTRQLSHTVQVHLLNGVTLCVKNLNKQSILGQVINAIHEAFLDLEFVNYGLCFMLDNEYFYLKEEINIQRLADYITQKLSSSKATNDNDNKKELHLYYRIKFYPTTEIINEMNSFNRKLFYLQLRQDLLFNNSPPINLWESFELAGLAVQAEHGQGEKSFKENEDYFKIEFYFHKLFRPLLDTNIDDISFLKFQQEPWITEDWEKCERIFIEKVCEKKYYGLHWYRVNKNQLGIIGAIGKNTYLVIGRDSIQLLDSSRSHADIQLHKHFSYKWRQIESISIKHKKLVIKPKMQLKVEGLNTTNAFVCYVDSKTKAEHIVRLCNEHHLLASQTDELDSSLLLTQTPVEYHHRHSTINYPSALIRNSLTYDDDNISVNDQSSEDEVVHPPSSYDEARGLSHQKYLHVGSMNNLSIKKKTRSTSFYSNSCQDINDEAPHLRNKEISLDPKFQYMNHKLPNDFFEVTLTRDKSTNDSLGLGIIKIKTPSCEGFFIKRIVKGSPTEKCGKLQIGDEIVIINDQVVSKMSQTEVGNIMKGCGKSIKLMIKSSNLKNKDDTVFRSIKKASSFSQTESTQSDFKSHGINKTKQNFKTTNKTALQDILKSNNAFKIFHQNILEKYFPTLRVSTISNQSYTSKINIDDYIPKEIRKLKATLLLRSASNLNQTMLNPKNHHHSPRESNGQVTKNCRNIKMQYNKLTTSHHSISSNNDLTFTLVQMEKKPNQFPWKFITENYSKLIISFNCNPTCWLSTNQHSGNTKVPNNQNLGGCTVNIDETHELSKSIVFYRISVSISKKESASPKANRMFLINFDNWIDEIEAEKSKEMILQAINVACGIYEHIPFPGPVVLYAEQLEDTIGMLISIYSLILLGVHRNLSISPIIKHQTIISEIFSQISSQMSEIVLNETQYRILISVVKQLMPYMDNRDSLSDVSDIN